MNDDALVKIQSGFSVLVAEHIAPATSYVPNDTEEKENLENKLHVTFLDESVINLLLVCVLKLRYRKGRLA